MPLLDFALVLLIFGLFVAWIYIVIRVLIDVIHSDLGGVHKAGWMLFVVMIPWLGVLVYLIVHGHDMSMRKAAAEESRHTRRTLSQSGFTTNEGLSDWREDVGIMYGRV